MCKKCAILDKNYLKKERFSQFEETRMADSAI